MAPRTQYNVKEIIESVGWIVILHLQKVVETSSKAS